jgi:hypothetical protein
LQDGRGRFTQLGSRPRAGSCRVHGNIADARVICAALRCHRSLPLSSSATFIFFFFPASRTKESELLLRFSSLGSHYYFRTLIDSLRNASIFVDLSFFSFFFFGGIFQ